MSGLDGSYTGLKRFRGGICENFLGGCPTQTGNTIKKLGFDQKRYDLLQSAERQAVTRKTVVGDPRLKAFYEAAANVYM